MKTVSDMTASELVKAEAEKGETGFGGSTDLETALADKLTKALHLLTICVEQLQDYSPNELVMGRSGDVRVANLVDFCKNHDYYLVVIEIQCGEYVKSCTKLVSAFDETEAAQLALEGECHGSIEDGTAEETRDGIADLGWTFHYSISSCVKVDSDDVPSLRKYL